MDTTPLPEPKADENIPKRPEGIDPEIADHVELCDELGLYLFLSSQGALLFQMARDIVRPEIRQDPQVLSDMNASLEKIRKTMNYSVSQTNRFGVEHPLEELPSQLIGQPAVEVPSKEYRLWSNWWYKFIYKDTFLKDWEKIKSQIEHGRDTSSIRPPGDWRPVDGILPKTWLKKVTSFEEVEATSKLASEKQWEALKNYSRKEDVLWMFKNPETKERGVTLVKNNRPVAMIYLQKEENESEKS